MTIRVNLSAGFGVSQTEDAGWLKLARDAESIGYEHLLMSDHLTHGGAAPFTAMAAAAAVTTHLRVGTYVLNNDLRHPAIVAHEFAALADLSGGRATLGLGAGHMKFEYDETGLPFDPPVVRVARMAESAEICQRMLAGEMVTFDGTYYSINAHGIRGSDSPPVRLLIGGNGTRVLQTAARLADVVGFTGFSPSLDGSSADTTHFTDVGLAERITVVRSAAGDRWPLPIDVLVQMVVITDRADVAFDRIATRMELPVEAVRASPFVLVGSVAAIVERLHELNERLGVTSVTVFGHRPHSDQTELTMAPVIEALG
jgi:probable F420-dependent oxidoreductase